MQRTRRNWLAVLALTIASAAGDVAAQDLVLPAARQGYYLGAGAYGVLDANFDEQRWYRGWPGFSGNLRAGQGLFDWLDVGLSIDFGFAAGRARQASFGGLSVEGQLHPFEWLAIRLGTGFGVLSTRYNAPKAGDELAGGIGGYFNLGVSYDWFFVHHARSGGWALSPVLQARLMPTRGVSAFLVWAGIELTWWLGLPDNQLELPGEEAYRS